MREKSPGGKNFLAFGSLVYEIRENSEKIFSLKNFWRRCRKILYSENFDPHTDRFSRPDEKPLDQSVEPIGVWKVTIVRLFVAGAWVERVE